VVKLPFSIKKSAAITVIGFLLILILMISCEDAEAETIIEAGTTYLSGHHSEGRVIMFNERFAGKYDIGVGIIGDQTCYNCGPVQVPDLPVSTNMVLQAQRIASWKPLEAGFGVAFWQNTNRALGSRFTFGLMLKVRAWRKLYVGGRHYSNGGSSSPNMGQDLVTLSWKF